MDYVVDINYLRTPADPTVLQRPELGALLQSSAQSDRFILTDTAVLETMKNAQWETTARASFRIISQFPQKVWLAKAPGNLIRNELDTGRETTEVIDMPASEGFRALMAELMSGVDGQSLAFARANVAAAQTDLAQAQQNHAANLQGLQLAVADIRSSIDLAAFRQIPEPGQKNLVRLYRIKSLAQVALKKLIPLEGKADNLGQTLAYGRGTLLRYQIGLYCLGFRWALNGTLSPNPSKATNELMDLDHALIATYCDDILTEEASVRELREDILQVLNSNIQFARAAAAPIN